MSAATQPKMNLADYYAAPGLSQSAMKDLAVSPLRFWHLHINPNRPKDEPSREMVVGDALHCLVLEPKKFDHRFACEFEPQEHMLRTIPELKRWLVDHDAKAKSDANKDALIAQVHAIDPHVPIVDVESALHDAKHEGKDILSRDDFDRVHRMAGILRDEPEVQKLLAECEVEVPMFAIDPETGVPLKARMDIVGRTYTADLKTFSVKRNGKSIDEAVADAIYFEQYYKQAYFYSLIRRLNGAGGNEAKSPDFIMPFIESEEPHDVRIRVLRPLTAGEMNLYWEKARLEVRKMIDLYADCLKTFGNDPWRETAKADPLQDSEIKGLPWS